MVTFDTTSFTGVTTDYTAVAGQGMSQSLPFTDMNGRTVNVNTGTGSIDSGGLELLGNSGHSIAVTFSNLGSTTTQVGFTIPASDNHFGNVLISAKFSNMDTYNATIPSLIGPTFLHFTDTMPFTSVTLNITPTLSADLISETGPQNAVVWDFRVFNNGTDPALNTQLEGLTLTQTSGAAGTPIINTTFPVTVGTISAGGFADSLITTDFTNSHVTDQFTVNLGFSSNGGANTGSFTLVDVSPYTGGSNTFFTIADLRTSAQASTVPEPSSLVLAAISLASTAGVVVCRRRQAKRQSANS
jgi:hypothetical protein